MCARGYQLFQDFKKLNERTDIISVLVLGPGNHSGFVPEWLEITSLLWNNEVNFVVVDHNNEVLQVGSNLKEIEIPSF